MQIRPQNPFPKRAILYYPTIDIPSSTWLRQAILYWDEINSIIPQDGSGELLSKLSTDVKFLMSEGEFKPINPENLIFNNRHRDSLHLFQEEFIKIISTKHFLQFLNRRYYQRGKTHPQSRYFSKIHSNKTSESIFNHLHEMGLARRTDDRQWLEMETNSALLYMSLLAKYLAVLQDDSTTIGTNFAIYEKMNFKRVNSGSGYPVVSLSLDRLLPTPQENVPLEKILDFKRKRKQNLIRFRKLLLDNQREISKAISNEELKELVLKFSEELILGVNDLKATMKDSKIGSGMKSLRSLINFQSAPSITAVGALAGNALDILPSNIAVPIAIVSGGIELGLNFIESQLDRSGNVRDSAFSYVYQAQMAGIIRPFRT